MARRRRKTSPIQLKLRDDIMYSLGSLLFIALSLLVMYSFLGKGEVLQAIALVLRTLFGTSAIIVPFLLFCAGLMLTRLKWAIAKPNVFLGACIVFIGFLGLFGTGSLGQALSDKLATLILPLGSHTVFLIAVLAGFLIMMDTGLGELLHFFASIFEIVPKPDQPVLNEKNQGVSTDDVEEEGMQKLTIKGSTPVKVNERKVEKEENKPLDPERKIDLAVRAQKPTEKKEEAAVAPATQPQMNVWTLPSTSLLDQKTGGSADRGNIKENASIIESTLESFGIKARVTEVNCGPAVTQYAIAIGSGTKLSKITALANDLALALAAPTGQIRIEAPIPGRSLVGIEIPNRSPEFVTLRTMLSSENMKKNHSKLAVALGLNVAGEPVVVDIAKMPHALIAGATGSGKSVAINTFISSILFRATPNDVKFIMVDPKRVELTGYNDIPHLLTPVITDPSKVVSALKWATVEMDNRYKLFAEVGVRNIEGYNELAGFQSMPYIVIVIDELADIMLFAPAEVEESITRLAQMARAVGIHLLLATQRPSVNVITGLIKANIPTRIAFNVSSMIDSRVIIDAPGAEKLLGKGDMLYVPPDQAKPSRVQGTYVSDGEIRRLIEFIKQQGQKPTYSEDITTKYQSSKGGTNAGGAMDAGGRDQLFVDAIRIVLKYDRASVSVLQRFLSVGYGRAARIMDQLCEAGIVGQGEGSKPREIFVNKAQEVLAQEESKN
ncbi:DNA translocase FtsK [Candidatus Cerribacteria bacterium 'Amazon FNV 2010 28 9']|uniref:DNA translocase FtsK n=1 Tax=Candidatus Cerribacteria bacterium 'Amazon FNV 2010 28 9' TaxID=2081795 RepID=A0A317JNY9_9BACT|nr:MAG: DNA translocase FtsK [Candidatus Cerribacteria bacterium 'Amazon FNV 2010 28 9']